MRYNYKIRSLTAFSVFCLLGIVFADSSLSEEARASRPLRIFVLADAHIRDSEGAADLLAFARVCNARGADLVLDLGDSVSRERRVAAGDESLAREIVLERQRLWLSAWQHIESEHKEVALGNHDVHTSSQLVEADWVQALGYEDRPLRGGSKLQTSLQIDNGHIKVLVLVLCTYVASHDRPATIAWIEQEVLAFDGDYIVYCNHHPGIYRDLRDMMMANRVRTPSLFLHGHNHGPDTLVRDAWGYEREDLPFPSYLLTAFRANAVGAVFELYRNGDYRTFRLNGLSGELSEPEIHYQTRVNRE